MSQLVSFYRGEGTDSEERWLAEILAWDDDDLEEVHDYIQWLFPLAERSRFNPDAPLLTTDDVTTFRGDPVIQDNLRRSFVRILRFLGLTWNENGQVSEGPTFAARRADVWAVPNHNWLRITRMVKSLRLLGLNSEAQAFFARLDMIYSSRKYPITAETFAYWKYAIQAQG